MSSGKLRRRSLAPRPRTEPTSSIPSHSSDEQDANRLRICTAFHQSDHVSTTCRERNVSESPPFLGWKYEVERLVYSLSVVTNHSLEPLVALLGSSFRGRALLPMAAENEHGRHSTRDYSCRAPLAPDKPGLPGIRRYMTTLLLAG